MRRILSQYWGHEATNFHEGWKDRFERLFLKHDVQVIDELEAVIASYDEADRPIALYEIGCGGGQVLNYLCGRLKGVEKFVGIDLGEDQITSNMQTYDDPKIAFHTADAVDWIPANAAPKSVVLTNGGVLEYFLREEVEALFASVGNDLKPATIVLIETIGSNHDLEASDDSFIYGRELSFSHNYPALLRKAGFEIRHQSERAGQQEDGGGRWLRVVATKT